MVIWIKTMIHICAIVPTYETLELSTPTLSITQFLKLVTPLARKVKYVTYPCEKKHFAPKV